MYEENKRLFIYESIFIIFSVIAAFIYQIPLINLMAAIIFYSIIIILAFYSCKDIRYLFCFEMIYFLLFLLIFMPFLGASIEGHTDVLYFINVVRFYCSIMILSYIIVVSYFLLEVNPLHYLIFIIFCTIFAFII
jgi:hypothetical protein